MERKMGATVPEGVMEQQAEKECLRVVVLGPAVESEQQVLQVPEGVLVLPEPARLSVNRK